MWPFHFAPVSFSPDDENTGGVSDSSTDETDDSPSVDTDKPKQKKAKTDNRSVYFSDGLKEADKRWARSMERAGIDLVYDDETGELDKDATIAALAEKAKPSKKKPAPKKRSADDDADDEETETERIIRESKKREKDAIERANQKIIEKEIFAAIPADKVVDREDVEMWLLKRYKFELDNNDDLKIFDKKSGHRVRDDDGELMDIESVVEKLLQEKKYLVKLDKRGNGVGRDEDDTGVTRKKDWNKATDAEALSEAQRLLGYK